MFCQQNWHKTSVWFHCIKEKQLPILWVEIQYYFLIGNSKSMFFRKFPIEKFFYCVITINIQFFKGLLLTNCT